MIPILTRNYDAGAAVGANLIVKPGATDKTAIIAAAATDAMFGVSPNFDTASGEPLDVQLLGVADVKLGGTVTRGGRITANASGQGVASAPIAGDNGNHVGIALASGVSGDIIPVLLAPGSSQGED